jgi:hypothetical protein
MAVEVDRRFAGVSRYLAAPFRGATGPLRACLLWQSLWICRGGYARRCHHRRRGSTGGGVTVGGGGTGSTGTSSGSEGGGWHSRRWSSSSGREAMISSQRGHWWGTVASVADRRPHRGPEAGGQAPGLGGGQPVGDCIGHHGRQGAVPTTDRVPACPSVSRDTVTPRWSQGAAAGDPSGTRSGTRWAGDRSP